jgi:hypothetical protein
MRDTPYLSQFDGDASFINLEEQENNMAKEQLIQQELRKMAREARTTHAGLQASAPPLADDSYQQNIRQSQAFYNFNEDTMDDIDQQQSKRDLEDKARKFFLNKKVKHNLKALSRATDSDFMEFATPRAAGGDTSSGTEYEEQAGSASEHGGYVAKTVRSIEKTMRRRIVGKGGDKKK